MFPKLGNIIQTAISISKASISKFIPEVCDAISEALDDHFQVSTS